MNRIFSGAMGRTVILGIFFAVCAGIMAVLFSGTGVRRPVIDSGEYTPTVDFKDVDNLVKAAQVQTAGIKVGQVRSLTRVDSERACYLNELHHVQALLGILVLGYEGLWPVELLREFLLR